MYLQTSEIIQYTLFAFFGTMAIAFSIYIVRAKNVFYGAVSLAFLGLSIAALIALEAPSTYGIYSVFHILLYVGATVTFLAISLVMFKDLEVRIRRGSLGILAGGAVTLLFLITIFISNFKVSPSTLQPINFQILANDLLENYWFPLIILIVALLTTLIEAIALARRD
ncbi:NADH-ubiquinone/plastoquinone oxidoreductase chain 6 [Sulfolobus islandicus Y.G.57.14]|jgi:NADH-quinone oxidoreductase subunit J|uniref:NADH:ubiquinone oxidoreductase subunit 6 (ChainJ) n=10 Tax=Saccharolobus islandicus TaxID=43080 RepID=M9UFV1_SACIS|nr:NADH-quinone oxidoreductase subunit J [Sulfolobus islandicus]ACP35909.1 NADH-ubiquinone/plastoquinone oxidoreductase chain 6 [Sulfolobus islandicus L.S.2.15]ACP38519.1 NADH-ubiquinone/plastoquinone oxidoreductase chain 6 [Sulfolobus islandicus M.14.25]ACP46147.1 NADH-ubiquinone/plastoquinone oxidoreductase chain 6 [Sulfolobus islandicus Y.G.57.14]ACP48141.1 NADH-ubiquinone/plastoquinone oxidoreductase chain 6 [Sulfolobus islandicus Y.N.15.51]ACP55763.1 NADH-ubiquinone/plastoquinone oxidored